MHILFEDNHLLIVNKPAGIVTQKTASFTTSLEEEAKAYIKQKYAKPGSVFLHAIHRLDRLVSGIVIFARTTKALDRLNESAREEEGFVKIYLAIVENRLKTTSGALEHFLVHGEGKAYVHADGKKCRLAYESLGNSLERSFVKIRLYTGRYHQIRAQFAAFGHPILGDSKYGSHIHSESLIALHHAYAECIHPVTKQKICSKAPLPQSSLWNEFPLQQ
jgi:23S rRNA pseudouridine1911/1915/1917 synthase